MEVQIDIKRRHALVIALLSSIFLGMLFVNAFGGSNPAVVGHSALELIVNSSSVVDDSLTGDDIDESTLGGVGPIIAIQAGTEQTIQAAINELITRGGGTVLMAAGTYTIAGPINMSSNISLVGQGSGTILQATANSIDIITEQNAGLTENVRLKDFAIRPGVATGLEGVVFTEVSGLIEGLDIQGMQGDSIRTTLTLAGTMLIQRNNIVMAAVAGDGISVTGGIIFAGDTGVTVHANVIDGNFSRGINCLNGVITDNKVVGQIGILAGSCAVIGNRVSSTTGAGISVTSGSLNTITGNLIEFTNDEGILFTGTGTIANNRIQSWSIGAGTHAGIRATTSGGATTSSITITGNNLESFSGGGEGINTSGQGVVITGNFVLPLINFYGIASANGETAITGNVIDTGGIFITPLAGLEATISGNTFTGSGTFDLNITSSSNFAVTGNRIRGDLDATGSSTCTLTGNVISGTLFAGTCSASNNI